MRTIFTAALALAASVAVQATPTRRDGCGGLLGTGDVANFTLRAAYTDSDTSVSLALVRQTPSLLNSWIAVSDLETPMTMVGGAITIGGAVSQQVDTTNGLLDFISFTSIAPYPAYCSATLLKRSTPDDDELPALLGALAVNGDANSFSICTATGIGKPKIVVYNAKKGATRFDYSTCKHVGVYLVAA
jgi:hypothetical protein